MTRGVQGFAADQDETCRLLLAGNDSELREALNAINAQLKLPMSGLVRSRFPGLSSEDLADVWQDFLQSLFRAVRKGALDLNKPLFPWMCTVILNIATDRVRRSTRRDRVMTEVGNRLRGTLLGGVWTKLGDTERHEILSEIRKAIAPLPAKQRVVTQVWVDGYPETTEMDVLRGRVQEATGHPETLAAVKRALQEGRDKVRRILSRKGYNPDDGGSQEELML